MAQQRVYVFLGMIASGKSTLARLWAEREGLACYNSDVVRKQLAGSEPEADCQDDFGRGIYTPEMTRRTYDALLDYAGREFEQGRSVVLDASYGNVDERNRVVTLATEAGVAVKFIFCHCDDDETARRLELRAQDPTAVSDGTWQVFLKQKSGFQYPRELAGNALVDLETCQSPDRLLAKLSRLF